MVSPVTLAPPSPEGFYAINNPFLVNGPKGFLEAKTLDNESYIRFDLPGVPRDGVTVLLDQPNNTVNILADAPKEHKYELRRYQAKTQDQRRRYQHQDPLQML
ncbi:unnamed protein product [Arabidopsis thaliana]|uniref:SHSP domain-containing protein n=1 Tax=Arabidopsis thaliana TaxID=3702 RepID=A0A654FPX6_ARATH|nr:unnamed protein product [Arabidopsis thaliana]